MNYFAGIGLIMISGQWASPLCSDMSSRDYGFDKKACQESVSQTALVRVQPQNDSGWIRYIVSLLHRLRIVVRKGHFRLGGIEAVRVQAGYWSLPEDATRTSVSDR